MAYDKSMFDPVGLAALDPKVAAYKKFIKENLNQPDLLQFLQSEQGQRLDPNLVGAMLVLEKLEQAKNSAASGPAPTTTVVQDVSNAAMQEAQKQGMAMPQDQGIAQLPNPAMDNAQFQGGIAQPPQQMAGGGIVAFAEGSKEAVSSGNNWTPAEEAELAKLENLMLETIVVPGVIGSPLGGGASQGVTPRGVSGLRAAYQQRYTELKSKKEKADAAVAEAQKQAELAAAAAERGLPALPGAKPSAAAAPAAPPAPPVPPADNKIIRRPGAAIATSDTTPGAGRAPAAPAAKTLEDFLNPLREANKPFEEATSRYEAFLKGDEATAKQEAKRDRMLALAQAGFAMAEAGSKPGATFFGAAGTAGTAFAKNMMQMNREADTARRNMQKELLALEQAKAANNVGMYNAAYQNYTKDRDFVTQVDQFNQGMRLQQAKLALERVLGMGQIQASMANAAATLGLRREELNARLQSQSNEMAVKIAELTDKRARQLVTTKPFVEAAPEQQRAMLADLSTKTAQEVAALTLSGFTGGGANTGWGQVKVTP